MTQSDAILRQNDCHVTYALAIFKIEVYIPELIITQKHMHLITFLVLMGWGGYQGVAELYAT